MHVPVIMVINPAYKSIHNKKSFLKNTEKTFTNRISSLKNYNVTRTSLSEMTILRCIYRTSTILKRRSSV